MDIDTRDSIDAATFLREYVSANRPVLLRGALTDWDLGYFTPGSLMTNFGDEMVQVYNKYFDLQDVCSLARYFDSYFDRPAPDSHKQIPYVRWYSKLRDVDFIWGDEALLRMKDHWWCPDFVPKSDYVLPLCRPPNQLDPMRDLFPARGMFISAAGARTALHVDPWSSDALLCHLFGEKSWLMYSPDQVPLLSSGAELVDPLAPDLLKFQHFDEVTPRYSFCVQPGDCVYVPHGWAHDVRTETDAISFTWNFVHQMTREPFLNWMAQASEKDLDVIRFFVCGTSGMNLTARQMVDLIRRTH